MKNNDKSNIVVSEIQEKLEKSKAEPALKLFFIRMFNVGL